MKKPLSEVAEIVRRPLQIELMAPFVEEVDIAAPLRLKLALETEAAEEMAAAPFEIIDEQGTVVAAGVLPEITQLDPDSDEYDPRNGPVDTRPFAAIEMAAPEEIGTFYWRVVLPQVDADGVLRERAELAFTFRTRVHSTSLAVWDNPSPIARGTMFPLKVGAKCTSGCSLAGRTVQILDGDGVQVAEAILGDTPRAGTTGLYWCEVAMRAPEAEARHSWSVRLAPVDHYLPHADARPAAFSFTVSPPAEHRVNVALSDGATQEPVTRAHVRLGAFRGETDDNGRVGFEVPPGQYKLFIWKEHVDAPGQDLRVDRDMDLAVTAEVHSEPDPYAHYYS